MCMWTVLSMIFELRKTSFEGGLTDHQACEVLEGKINKRLGRDILFEF